MTGSVQNGNKIKCLYKLWKIEDKIFDFFRQLKMRIKDANMMILKFQSLNLTHQS